MLNKLFMSCLNPKREEKFNRRYLFNDNIDDFVVIYMLHVNWKFYYFTGWRYPEETSGIVSPTYYDSLE